MDLSPKVLGRVLQFLLLYSHCFNSVHFIGQLIYPKKDFSRIINDVNGYGHIFFDRIKERHWHELLYDNTDDDVL